MKNDDKLAITTLILVITLGLTFVFKKGASKEVLSDEINFSRSQQIDSQRHSSYKQNRTRTNNGNGHSANLTRPDLAGQAVLSSHFDTKINPSDKDTRDVAFKNNEALIQALQDLKYQKQKQDEFLKYKVGLDQTHIEMVHQKTRTLKKELKVAEILAKTNWSQAQALRKMAIERHIIWMSYVLGPQNFENYLNVIR